MELPKDYIAVLREVTKNREENFLLLAETLSLNSSRLAHVVRALQHKGLILVDRATYADMWIRLSTKGERLAGLMRLDSAVTT